MVQKLAWVFAAIFILVGVLGYVPGITSDGMLLGIFHVDSTHNIIHIVSGLLFAAAAWASAAYSRLVFQIMGVVYAIVMVVGFVQGSTVLGLIGVNMADNVLHLVLAAAMLYIGFMMKSSAAPAMASQPRMDSMDSANMGGGQGM